MSVSETVVGAEVGFNSFVGPVTALGDGRFELAIEPRHMNGADRLHGGMTMSLASIVLGEVAKAATGGAAIQPLSLNCDFVAAGELGETVSAAAEVTRRTRTVIFLSAVLSVGERTLMTASGVYRIVAEEDAA